jgi:hypothetical protein
VKEFLIEILKLIRTTKIDDLPPVIECLLENYEEDIIPIACEISEELV